MGYSNIIYQLFFLLFLSSIKIINTIEPYQDKSYEIKEIMQNILFTENTNPMPLEEIINDYTNFATQELQNKPTRQNQTESLKSKLVNKIVFENKELFNCEILNYQQSPNFNKDLKYSWLFMGQKFNISFKNHNFFLDSNKKDYLKLDYTSIDFGERQLYVPCVKNNTIKSFSMNYHVKIIKMLSLCENVKIHFQNTENPDLGSFGSNYSFFVTLIPDKIGEFNCIMLVNMRIKKKESSLRTYEKIMSIEIKAKVIENQYRIKEMQKFKISLDDVWNFSFFLYNPFNKSLLIRDSHTSNKNLKIEIGSDEKTDLLNEDKKLVVKSKQAKTINIIFNPPTFGYFNCSITLKTDADHLYIPLKINVINRGVNFIKDYLDLGIITQKMTAHKIPLIVLNTYPKTYEVKDIIVYSKESIDFQIFYEKTNQKIDPSYKSNETFLGNLIIKPISYEKNGYIEGNIYLLLNDTTWNPEEEDRKYSHIKIGFGGGYYENLISYDKMEFSSFIEKKSNYQPISWPLTIKNNLFFSIIINNFTYSTDIIDFHSFKTSSLIKSNESKILFHVTLTKPNITEKTIIFLDFFGYNLPIIFLTYDASVLTSLLNQNSNEKISEFCKVICTNIFLDYGIFSTEERRKKTLFIQNINPVELELSISDINNNNIFFEFQIVNENKGIHEDYSSKKQSFILCPYCNLIINVSVRSNKAINETFFLEFSTKYKNYKNSFRLFGKYATVNGNLIITASNIRFQPSFPGLINYKYISIKSTFSIDCKATEVESTDPRIIPYIIKDTISGNSREEFLKLVFDPSISQNYLREDEKNEKISPSLTYEDFFLWKDYKQYWDNVVEGGNSDLKAIITIKFDLINSISFNVKGYLKPPILTQEDSIDFGVNEIGTINLKNFTLVNPSDKMMIAQLYLGLDDDFLVNYQLENYINNIYRKSIEMNQSLLCNNMEFYNNKKQNNWNFKTYAEYLNKKNSENNVQNSNESQEKEIDIMEINKINEKMVSLLFPFKINLDQDDTKDYCNSTSSKKDLILKNQLILKEINEIKSYTEKEYKETEIFLKNFTLSEKMTSYLSSWLQLIPEKRFQNEPIHDNQTFYLEKNYLNRLLYIPPHSNLTIPALIFKPNRYRTLSSFTLYIKNNLTFLYPLKLKGIGGKGDIQIIEKRILLDRNGTNYFSTEKIQKENDKIILKFSYHPEEFLFYDFFLQNPSINNYSEFSNSVIRYFRLKNFGNIAINIEKISIEREGCEGFGFRIVNCHNFILPSNGNYVLEIEYKRDFCINYISKILYLYTNKEIIKFHLEAEFPNIFSMAEENIKNPIKLNFIFKEGTALCLLVLLFISLIKSFSYKSLMRNKAYGIWKLVEASDIFELRDQNSVFSFENDIYELRRLRQAVKQTSTKGSSIFLDNVGGLISEPEHPKEEFDKKNIGNTAEEQGNQGKQILDDEQNKDLSKTLKKEEKSKKLKREEKRKATQKKETIKKKNKKESTSTNTLQIKTSQSQIEDTPSEKESEIIKTLDTKEEPEPHEEEIIESIATEEKTQIKEEIQPLEIPIQNISELEVSKIIENLPKDEEFPQRLEIDSDNQEDKIDTDELFENAELINPSEKPDLGYNIGIIGSKKKVQESTEDSFFSSIEKPKQYYDPFNKYGYGGGNNPGLRAENNWFSSGTTRKNTSGLGLFTTNRENKYSMFSDSLFYNAKKEEENEEEDSHQKSFEGSESEFSDKSFVQFQKNKNQVLETPKNEDINFNTIPIQNVERPIENSGSSDRFFRTFNFPQGNNPFSLSQLLNIKGNDLDSKQEKTMNLNAVSFKSSFEQFGGVFNEEFKNNNLGYSGKRKPPPGFKPNS